MSWQKSPLTSSTSAAARSCGSFACQDKICCANGCMQAEVLPDPTAPKIATPVYSPRSGITSHFGFGISTALTGW